MSMSDKLRVGGSVPLEAQDGPHAPNGWEMFLAGEVVESTGNEAGPIRRFGAWCLFLCLGAACVTLAAMRVPGNFSWEDPLLTSELPVQGYYAFLAARGAPRGCAAEDHTGLARCSADMACRWAHGRCVDRPACARREREVPLQGPGGEVKLSVIYEAAEGLDGELALIGGFERELLALGPWSQWCLKAYAGSSARGSCAAPSSLPGLFSMTAAGRNATREQAAAGYSSSGPLAECFCGRPGLCDFCDERGASEEVLEALSLGRSQTPSPMTSRLNCLLQALAAGGPQSRLDGAVELLGARREVSPGSALSDSVPYSSDFDFAFTVRPRAPARGTSANIIAMRASNLPEGAADGLPSFFLMPGPAASLFVSVNATGEQRFGTICDVPFQLPLRAPSRVSVSMNSTFLLVRVNGTPACHISGLSNVHATDAFKFLDVDVFASVPDAPAAEAEIEEVEFRDRSRAQQVQTDRMDWKSLSSPGVALRQGGLVGEVSGVWRVSDCQTMCESTPGCLSITHCKVDSGRCAMFSRTYLGFEPTNRSGGCSTYYAVRPSTVERLEATSAATCEARSGAAKLKEWMQDYCKRRPTCDWSPPHTSELCSSRSFYHATDVTGLVGENDQAKVFQRLCDGRDTAWRHQRHEIFPASMRCDSTEVGGARVARTSFYAGATEGSREYDDFMSYMMGEGGWHDQVRELKRKYEKRSGGGLRIMLHSGSIESAGLEEALRVDVALVAASGLLVLALLWWTLESLFLTLCAGLEVAFALSGGLLLWEAIGQPLAYYQGLMAYFAVVVGVRGCLSMVDVWKQSRHLPARDDIRHWTNRFAWAYRRSLHTLTVACATAVLCFLAGVAFPLPKVRLFCLFASLVLVIDWAFCATFFAASIVLSERLFSAQSRPKEPGTCGGPGCCFGFLRLCAWQVLCIVPSPLLRRSASGQEMVEKRPLERFCEERVFRWLTSWRRLLIVAASVVAVGMALYGTLQLATMSKPRPLGRRSLDAFRSMEVLADDYDAEGAPVVSFVYGLDVERPMREWGARRRDDVPMYDAGVQVLSTPSGQKKLLDLCRSADYGEEYGIRCDNSSCLMRGDPAPGSCAPDRQAWRGGAHIAADPLCAPGRYCFMEVFAQYWALAADACMARDEAACADVQCAWDTASGVCYSTRSEEDYDGLPEAEFLAELGGEGFASYLERRDAALRAAGRGHEVDAWRRHTGFNVSSGQMVFAWVTFNATFPRQNSDEEATQWRRRWDRLKAWFGQDLGGFHTASLYVFNAEQRQLASSAPIGFGFPLLAVCLLWVLLLGNWQLALLGFVNLGSISVTFGGLVPLIGWEVADTQCIFFVACVALGGHFTAFWLHSYRRMRGEVTREGVVRSVLTEFGITAMNSTVTLLLCGGLLLGCGFLYFVEIGAFLVGHAALSALMSFSLLLPLMLIVGPEGTWGDLPCPWTKALYLDHRPLLQPEAAPDVEAQVARTRTSALDRTRVIFQFWDADEDGLLSRDELFQALSTSTGPEDDPPLPQGAVESLVAMARFDATGRVGLEEFARICSRSREVRPTPEESLQQVIGRQTTERGGKKVGKSRSKAGRQKDEAEDTDPVDEVAEVGAAAAEEAEGEEGRDEVRHKKTHKRGSQASKPISKPSVKSKSSSKERGASSGSSKAATEASQAEEASAASPAEASAEAPRPAPVPKALGPLPGLGAKPFPGLPRLPSAKSEKAERAETEAKAEPEAKPEAEPEARPEAKPEARPEAKPEAKPKAEEAPKKREDEKAQSLGKLRELLALGTVSAAALEAAIGEAKAAGAVAECQEAELRLRAMAAEAALEEAVAARDGARIRAAISEAEAAGASQEAMRKAREALEEEAKKRAELERQRQEEEQKSAAREALKGAMASRDIAGLRAAIASAEAQGLEAEAAKAQLREEEALQKAREELAALKGCQDPALLEAGLAAARAAGLTGALLAEIEALKAAAERRLAAEAALAAAVASPEDLAALRAAIEAAEAAGAEAPKLEEAKRVLREEEPRAEARAGLQAAKEAGTQEALRGAIEAARAAGLREEEVAEAVELLRREEEKERQLAALKGALQESLACDMKSIDAVRAAKEALTVAIRSATDAGVPEAELRESELRRKKLHNTVEDLKGSIRVFCRIRPLSSKERDAGDTNVCRQLDPMTLEVQKEEGGLENFQFDAVFTPGTQDEIFEDCRDLVQSAVDGYNVTLFAYGQTGAGKTFTMAGVPGQLGVSPRTITEIFDVIERGKNRFDYEVTGSMLELYRQDLVDLLAKGSDSKVRQKALNIRQDKSGSVIIENLTEEPCRSADELSNVLARGNDQRTVAATAMNSESSRSHLVLVIRIQSTNKETKEVLKGKILIVDLAGSERLKKSQTTADMQKESIEINKSLTALGDVIEALTKSQKQIPYRNHRLTQLMQDSLGGTAKTLMFVNCSPANSNCDETVMSLKYAARAKKITNSTKGPNSS